ncbi:tRNA (cytidine(32)/guanosine(34)-2'-O)-methyltransferase-like [Periplaneta americana]|uniref:tRNA (cytidine(32)/guanosine(34)-2'-O)-methyltransferase-like n=1 Tax=Periplaneta americana TaxID=6978 RepID=UPI0037E7930D
MGKSSRDKRDVYYRFAKEGHFRSRSAFKLLQIDEEFDLFTGVSYVVDLCAVPGGWSQVILQRLGSKVDDQSAHIVAVDVQPMAPLQGVVEIKGDITKKETAAEIIEQFKGKPAQLVLCDGAPDVIGMPDFDEYTQGQLMLAALDIAIHVLAPGGTFLTKAFRGKNIGSILSHFQMFFVDVIITKPRTSRNSSIESFVLCKEFTRSRIENPDRPITFKACGSEEGYDSDTTYSLELEDREYTYTEPEQVPIEPPYAHFLSLQQDGKIRNIRLDE